MMKSKYSILIICEGENTEPSFFNSIKDRIISEVYDIDAVINILPEPKIDSIVENKPNKHKTPRKKRDLKQAIGNEPKVIDGIPPLKWVLHGIEELKSETHNEIWVVYDHDNHPARKEAFEIAESTIINGNKVNLAFTSRSFEYFLLLCFERIYKQFEKTDCKYDNKNIKCGSNISPLDCHGELCINGYAREKGYWEDSKSQNSIFFRVEDKLEKSLENSAWLRFISNKIEGVRPIYNRNPYTNLDSLISRLTNIPLCTWAVLDEEYHGLTFSQIDVNHFSITNNSKIVTIINAESFFICSSLDGSKICFGERFLLKPNESNQVTLPKVYEAQNYSVGIIIKGAKIMFELQ